MRKYFLGILALVLATVFCAFAKPTKRGNTYIFKFDTTNATTSCKNCVEAESNWKFDRTEDETEPQSSCVVVDEQACEIGVFEELIDCPGCMQTGARLDIVAPLVVIAADLEGTSQPTNTKYAVYLPLCTGVQVDLDTVE